MQDEGTKMASRRNVLKGAGMATIGATLPLGGVLAQNAPSNAPASGAPAAAAKAPKLLEMDGKAKLAVLGDRPLVAETQAALMDDDVTPTDKLFVRNNGQFPEMPANAKACRQGDELGADRRLGRPTRHLDELAAGRLPAQRAGHGRGLEL